MDKFKRQHCVFVCTANPYILCNDEVIIPHLDPSQTPQQRMAVFLLSESEMTCAQVG